MKEFRNYKVNGSHTSRWREAALKQTTLHWAVFDLIYQHFRWAGTHRLPGLSSQFTWWRIIQMAVNFIFQPQLLWAFGMDSGINWRAWHSSHDQPSESFWPVSYLSLDLTPWKKNINQIKLRCLFEIIYSVLFCCLLELVVIVGDGGLFVICLFFRQELHSVAFAGLKFMITLPQHLDSGITPHTHLGFFT